MANKTRLEITFARLTDVSPGDIIAHMSEPRVIAHMPLAPRSWDLKTCDAFVGAKEACWHRDGLGHWAILCNGAYAGWGGFQKEGEEWDYGLVLTPENFGNGGRRSPKKRSHLPRLTTVFPS